MPEDTFKYSLSHPSESSLLGNLESDDNRFEVVIDARCNAAP